MSKNNSPQNTLAELLTAQKLTLRVAESFTGGYLTSLLTAIEGASAYLFEAIIAYSPQSKIARLGVVPQIIKEFGTVSGECCKAMLEGLINSGCDLAIATTGNAGPAAEREGDVGLCFAGAAYKGKIRINRCNFTGTRTENIHSGAAHALNLAISLIESQ